MGCDSPKIDYSFISDIETQGLKLSLIPQIVEIANKTGLKMVAEGIETEGQRSILLELGAQFGQDWLRQAYVHRESGDRGISLCRWLMVGKGCQ